ncbi:MAG: transcriptional regulator, partial [Aeromicrobium sp.]|nr:transcriptional regulator [Aeromicrobium sp.]
MPSSSSSSSRDTAILSVTADLLAEQGWEKLTMRAVAEGAGVSLSTIYDQWPTKTELAVAAVKFALLTGPQTLESLREVLSERPNLVLCLLSIQRSDQSYRDVIRAEFAESILGPMRASVLALTDDGLDHDTAS